MYTVENLSMVFDYFKAKEMTFTNIGSTDVMEGNGKLILGLIWKVILSFAIDEEGKNGLLLWCQRSTKEFDTQNVNFGVKVNLLRNMSESLGIKVSKAEKQKAKNSKQLAKVLEKNTIHVHCTNTLKEWVAFQNNQRSNASLSEHIKLNLKDYMK